jgi:hypothetical protein
MAKLQVHLSIPSYTHAIPKKKGSDPDVPVKAPGNSQKA